MVTEWPERLDDGSVIVAVHVVGDQPEIREPVEVLLARWRGDGTVAQSVLDEMRAIPYVERRLDEGVDVVFRVSWLGLKACMMSFSRFLTTQGRGLGLRDCSIQDRVGGETRLTVRISS